MVVKNNNRIFHHILHNKNNCAVWILCALILLISLCIFIYLYVSLQNECKKHKAMKPLTPPVRKRPMPPVRKRPSPQVEKKESSPKTQSKSRSKEKMEEERKSKLTKSMFKN